MRSLIRMPLFERVFARHLHLAVDARPLRSGDPRFDCRRRSGHQRADDAVAARLEIEHGDAVARHQHDVGGAARAAQSRAQIGRRHHDLAIRRQLRAGSSR